MEKREKGRWKKEDFGGKNDFLVLGVGEVDDVFPAVGGVNVAIKPYSGILGGDSAFGRNGRCFDNC